MSAQGGEKVSPGVEFNLLGPFEVVVDGAPVPLGGPRQQAVLALLLLESGHPLSAERMLDTVWDGRPPASAASTLYAYIARLRKVLGSAGGALQRVSGGYVLDVPTERVDVWRFDAAVGRALGLTGTATANQVVEFLDEALSWWRGPLLEGLSDDAPWVLTLRTRFEDRRLAAVEALAQAQLELGRHELAVDVLDEMVQHNPHREAMVALLMTALYRAGRQADALAAYHRCRMALDDDLGLEPSQPLRDLHLAVLEQRPDLHWSPPVRRPARRWLPLRNPRFFGRTHLLEVITRLLQDNLLVAASGLGGTGKTELALEIAHLHRGYTCWINAENDATMVASFTSIAAERGIRTDQARDHSHLLRMLFSEFDDESDPLLVFDNAGDPAAIRPYLPPLGQAKILVTSRSAAWGSLGASLQIGPFTDAESASFLVERTRLQDPVTARQLAADLGNLPLACAQAAAFIEQSGVDLREYRELFQRSSRQLLERGAPDGYGGTVGTTWQIGFNRVAADAPQAAYLLEVLAFLSPDGVPTRLVRELFGPAGTAGVADPDLAVADAVAHLRQFSLIDRDGSTLRVHRLVQAVVRSRLDPLDQQQRLTTAVGLLTAVEPGDPTDPGSWARWAMLAPHLLVLGTLADELMLRSVPLVALMRTSAAYLRQRGSVRAACAMMGTAMTLGLRDLDDPQVLGEMHSELGDFYDARGDVHAAREEHAKAIDLLVGQLDPADFRLALARARFGHLLHCEGDEQGAITTLEAVLPALAESVDHRYLARAWIDLGYTYWAAGGLQKSVSDLDRSAVAFEQAGRILAALPAPARALYAEAASGLGMVRQDQGDLDLASELLERALAALIELHGDVDHPDIAQLCDKQGYLLRLRGDVEGAVRLHTRAHRILSATLGDTDPRAAMALTNLGVAQLAAGDVAAASVAQRSAHALLVAAYGPEHPNVQIVQSRLVELQAVHS
jgi:DNA-binding SARP family transcriptional activator